MLKSLNPLAKAFERVFATPDARVYAARELATARLELLDAQSLQEYATAMVQYNSDRVARLESFVKES